MSKFRSAVAAVLVAVPLTLAASQVPASADTVPDSPAVDLPTDTTSALFTCQTMGSAGNGKTLYICEGWNGTIWLIIA